MVSKSVLNGNKAELYVQKRLESYGFVLRYRSIRCRQGLFYRGLDFDGAYDLVMQFPSSKDLSSLDFERFMKEFNYEVDYWVLLEKPVFVSVKSGVQNERLIEEHKRLLQEKSKLFGDLVLFARKKKVWEYEWIGKT